MSLRDQRRGNCQRCGKSIIWGVTAEGKKIPLDPTPPVYEFVTESGGTVRVRRNMEAAVTHFATCPYANDFSRRNKETPHE